MFVGSGGGGRRFRHPQIAFGPLRLDVVSKDDTVLVADGKFVGRTCRSFSAFSDSRQPLVFRAKYMIWCVLYCPAVMRTGSTPINSSRVLVTPRIAWDVGMRLSSVQFS